MTHRPDATITVIVNSGAQQQAMKIVHTRSRPVFSALVGVCQGSRCWITDLQDDLPVWVSALDSEPGTKSDDALSRWYDGYRAGLKFARLGHLGWWWHCGEAPPQAVEDVLRMPEFTRVLTQFALSAVPCICWLIRHPPLELSGTPHWSYPAALHSANELQPL